MDYPNQQSSSQTFQPDRFRLRSSRNTISSDIIHFPAGGPDSPQSQHAHPVNRHIPVSSWGPSLASIPRSPVDPFLPHSQAPTPPSFQSVEPVEFSHRTSIYDSFGSSTASLFDVSEDDGVYLDDDDTQTLASYVTQYRIEYGRRYHAYQDGAYWGPNDDIANTHQDLAHDMYVVTLDGRLHLAPIGKSPHNVLDVGTGTGIWAIQMAELYPSAEVIGIDLSPIQPTTVPPNCTFQIDDMTLPWTFPPGWFDFVHVREMFGSISNWPDFLDQARIHMKPGGWIEIVEHSVEPEAEDMPDDHFFRDWGNLVISTGEQMGKTFTIWKDAKAHLERAGFVDVVEHRFIWPINGWSKDDKLRMLGLMNQVRLLGGIEGFMLRLMVKVRGWSYEQAQVYLAHMRENVRDHSLHAYLSGTVVYGRKPLP